MVKTFLVAEILQCQLCMLQNVFKNYDSLLPGDIANASFCHIPATCQWGIRCGLSSMPPSLETIK